MISKITMTALALCTAGGLTIASASQAAPVMGSATAVKAATTDHVTDAQWRGRRWGGGWRGGAPWVAGAAIGGLALGAAAAASPYYHYDGPYGGPVAYDDDYAPGPYYYGRPYRAYGYRNYGW